MENNTETKFVTVVIAESQLINDFTSKKEGRNFSRIITPEGYTFIRPSEQVKVSQYQEKKLFFSLPEEMKVTMTRSKKDDNGNFIKAEDGSYITESKTVSGQELADMYKAYFEERKNSEDFVVITVSKAQVLSSFEKSTEDGSNIMLNRIITPEGSTFIRPAGQLHEQEDGKVHFALHKDMNITLSKKTDRVVGKTDEGKNIYEEINKIVTAAELQNMFAHSYPSIERSFKQRAR